jgi:hypothetical protein
MLRKETVSEELVAIAVTLCAIPELKSFRIVGGTALALHIGHRKSIDVDFFSNEIVDRKSVLRSLKNKFLNTEFFVTEHNIIAEINGVRVELYDDWSVPFQSEAISEEGFRIASLKDLAAFKLNAITERREKKDYIDLYFLFQQLGVQGAFDAFKISNPLISEKSILFALTEVVSAESNKSPTPDMLTELSWSEIKKSMLDAARLFMQLNLAKGNSKSQEL